MTRLPTPPPPSTDVGAPLVLGGIGIGLGVVGVLLSAVPMGAFLGWPLALVAVVLGVLALCLPGRRTVVGATAVGLGVLAVPVGVVVPFLLVLGFAWLVPAPG